jgi:hypothetical protein
MAPLSLPGPVRLRNAATISLFLDIGQGAGLAGASGVRPFLPPLLAGALARGDIGVDFSGTSYDFLESSGFLLAVLALAFVAYVLDRRRPGGGARDPAMLFLGAVALVVGALLFAGSLAEGHHQGWPGLLAGAACAALGYLAVALLFSRARRRIEGSAAALLSVYADGIALVLAALAIWVQPVGILAVIVFAVLIARARASGDRKYEGLRVLR